MLGLLVELTVTLLFLPDIIPLVTLPIYSFPIGEPTANIVSPILEFSLLPSSATERTADASTLNTATSVYSSLPRTLAVTVCPCIFVVWILDAPSITW